MTLASLSNDGKVPEENERLIKVDSVTDKSCLSKLKILGGTLLGPDALCEFKPFIHVKTSGGDVGLKKIESGLELLK